MTTVEVLVLLLCAVVSVEGRPWFLVTAPNIIREGEDTKVFVTTSGVTAGTVVNLQLGNGPVRSVAAVGTTASTTVKLTRDMIGEANDQGLRYVRLRAHSNNHGFDERQNILVSLKSATVFIQTDKPIYRPKEYVRIRIYTVDDEFKSLPMDVQLDIQNPDGLVLDRSVLTEVKQNNGIHERQYKLPEFIKDGNWTLVASYGLNYAMNTTTKIEVKDYILPHFDVSITLSKDYILKDQMVISGNVEARYSFSATLSGKVRLVFRKVEGGDAVMIPGAILNKQIWSGTASFSMNLTKYLSEDFNSLVNKRVQVEATVTEGSSGIRETAINRDCVFAKSPYVISFEGTPWNFAPGVPFRFEARIKHINGKPAKEVPVHISALTGKNLPLPGETAVSRISNDDGLIVHTFNIPGTLTQLKIIISTIQTGIPTTRREFVVNKMAATSYMYIESKKKQVKVNTDGAFKVTFTKGTQVENVYATVVSGGRILETKKVEVSQATVANLNLRITTDMVPYFRIVMWYVNPSNQLVTTSLKYVTEKKCRNEVTVEGGGTDIQPDARVTLKITAQPNATVALSGVDEAVYFLRNNDVLDRPRFFSKLEGNDIGCGIGGGTTPQDVFKLSGVTLMNNFGSQTTPRQSVACQERDPQPLQQRRRRSLPETGENDVALKDQCCQRGGEYSMRSPTIMKEQSARSSYCASQSANRELPAETKSCKNAFYKCCYGNATEAYIASLPPNARTSGDEEENMDDDEYIKETDDVDSRKNFRETWLFHTWTVPKEGVITREVTAPSSITTWILHTVSMSPSSGMCVAERFKIPVKKDLFIKLHLPKTAFIGEHLQLKATIYNTMKSDATANIYHVGSSGLCTEAAIGKKKVLRRGVKIRVGSSLSLSWLAVPTHLGKVMVKVVLFSNRGDDSVEREITVVPSGSLTEGKAMIMTQSFVQDGVFNETNGEGVDAKVTVANGIQRNEIKLELPPEAIGHGYHAQMDLAASPMVQIVEAKTDQADIHVVSPRHCPEQTMSRFGPTVYSGRYLRDSGLNLMTSEKETKIKKSIEQGIDNMVNKYRRQGAFGRGPSLWLTSFTLKIMYATKDFSDKVKNDPSILNDARNFVLQKQKTSGAWMDNGYWSYLMGGVLKDEDVMTAYVLICLLESGTSPTNQRIQNGIDFLQTVQSSSAPYKLALTAYALALAQHTRAVEVLGWLNDKAQTVPGTVVQQKFWSYGINRKDRYGRWYISQNEVETNGYGLLAMVTLGRIEESAPHVEWLIRQKMSSTQARVVSIQALAEYSIKASKPGLDVGCILTGKSKRHTFNRINLQNSAVNQRKDVTKYVGSTVYLDCDGRGKMVASVKMFYYAKKTAESKCAFKITTEINPKKTTSNHKKDLQNMVINVCATLKPSYNKTGMAIIDVGLGSGYSPMEEDLKQLEQEGKISLYDVFNQSVAFYLDEITSQAPVCVKFGVTSDVEIRDMRPVPINVYDYYEPDPKQCVTYYHPHGEEDTRVDTLCSDNRKTCECLENNCPIAYGYDIVNGDEIPKTEDQLMHFACMQMSAQRPDYVFKARVTTGMRQDESGVREAKVKILKVYNQSPEVSAAMTDTIIPLLLAGACPLGTPRLQEGKIYLLMVREARSNEGSSKYFLNQLAYVAEVMHNKEIRKLPKPVRKPARDQGRFLKKLSKTGCSESP